MLDPHALSEWSRLPFPSAAIHSPLLTLQVPRWLALTHVTPQFGYSFFVSVFVGFSLTLMGPPRGGSSLNEGHHPMYSILIHFFFQLEWTQLTL